MYVSGINNCDVNFGHRIFIDIGASNPKGTLKISAVDKFGKNILKEQGPNSYLNNTVKGFENAQDFIDKVAKVIKRTYERVLLKDKSGEFILSEDDKLLDGVAVFVPGTTYSLGKGKDVISFMPNLRDKKDNSLTNVDFSRYVKSLKSNDGNSGININPENFNFVVTKDLGGAGVGLAKLLAQRKMLKEGDYVMGVMTGGGFGSVDLKVQKGVVNFETSESSSYVAGNYMVYDTISKLMEEAANSKNPVEHIEKMRSNNNEIIKEKVQILGKLGRQGVNVKSHIGTFCTEIGRPDLFPLLKSVGDARIVEMNRMCVSEKDKELVEQLRSMSDIFREIESTTDGKIAFEIREESFEVGTLKRARTVAVNEYANALSLISINKIDDCINKVVLLGPFAHGVNQYVKTHSADFGGAKDLPELVERKIRTNIDANHVDLPSTEKLMDLYKFKVICDSEINFADNTFAGDLLLNPKCKFVPNRGSWFSVPLSVLKNAK